MKEIIHKTKYDIGDKVYWLDKRDGIYSIQKTDIRGINIGGKSNNKYEVNGFTTRGEYDLFDTFEEAQKKALEKQIESNKRTLEIISEYKDFN